MKKNTRAAVVSGLLWRLLEKSSTQGVTLVVSVILARLLDPAVYGTVAIVTTFTTILGVFVDSCMGSALIQKKEADDLDFSSLFYFNLFICGLLYLLVYFLAPVLAGLYRNMELVRLIRVSSVVLIISGVTNIQVAYVSRNMLFKRFFKATLWGTVSGAAVGIWMACNGFGVWALVGQNLSTNAISTLVLWTSVKWRPKWMFSFSRLWGLFAYGWKLLVSSLLNTVFSKINSLTIGLLYNSEDLAYYAKGNLLPQTMVNCINGSVDSVLFPALSAEQSDQTVIKAMTRRAIKLSSYLMWPVMIGLAACAAPLIEVLLTEKWLPCVPFFVIHCVIYAFFPVNTANLNAIKAIGRSDLILKLEIVKKTMSLLILVCTMRISVLAMTYGFLLSSILCQVVNAWPNRKLLNYSHMEQIADIFPAMALAAVMGGLVYCVTLLDLHPLLTLLIQVPLGVVIYVLGSAVLRMDSFTYLLRMLKDFLPGK
jgi:O-antigen/teichoic acid export membrane protein